MKRLMMVSGVFAATALLVPASSLGARFGERMDLYNPINSFHQCAPVAGQHCSRVGISYDHPVGGQPRSPINGTIKKIKLRGGTIVGGVFRLQLAKAVGTKAKVTTNGPVIHYTGGDFLPKGPEVFPVNVPVKKGEYLTIKSKTTSLLRCKKTGNPRSLLFEPPLVAGANQFRDASVTSRCMPMLLAVVKP